MPRSDDLSQHGRPRPERSPWGSEDALHRLEAVLDRYPEDRALPPVETVIAAADVAPSLLREDDRARKLIVEALLARPLSRLEDVSGLRTEVELLTLEVEVLTERLEHPDLDRVSADDAVVRLDEVRGRLAEIRALL